MNGENKITSLKIIKYKTMCSTKLNNNNDNR